MVLNLLQYHHSKINIYHIFITFVRETESKKDRERQRDRKTERNPHAALYDMLI